MIFEVIYSKDFKEFTLKNCYFFVKKKKTNTITKL